MRYRALFILGFLLGCATDPLRQFELGSPSLTEAQVHDLKQRSQSPAQLGIQVRPDALLGVNGIDGTDTVMIPLLKVDRGTPEPGSRYRVPVIAASVPGEPPVRLMLDSGSNRLLLGYSLARELQVPTIAGLKPVTARGIGGAVDNYIGIIPSIDIGSLHLRKMVAMISPDAQVLNFTRGFWGRQQVIILGVSVLRPLAYLSIDNLRGEARFSPHEPYTPDRTRQLVAAIQLRWQGDLPLIDVAIDGKPVPCILDTGGDYGMLVPRSLAGPLGYWKPGKERLGASSGVGGASLTTQYTIRSVKVGNAVFEQVPARTDLSGPEPAGGYPLMGNVVLRRHKVTFDFRSGVVWLER